MELAQPKGLDLFFFIRKNILLIPIWKKSTFVFLPCFNLKKQCMFISIYPLATYGSDIYLWIPHTSADLGRQGSWPELFNNFFLGLLNWARPSAQYLHFLWAKHLWNGIRHAKGYPGKLCIFIYHWQKMSYIQGVLIIPGRGRETQKHHPCHFGWLIPL